MNWTKPSEDLAVLVARGDDDMTNYERIKEMSLNELAEFLCNNTRECHCCNGFDYCVLLAGTANGLIKWLKMESEE